MWNHRVVVFSLTVVIFLHSEAMAKQGEIRCHCNLPVCVATGYMCKSNSGTCFSELSNQSDLSKSRHGCVEFLNQTMRDACQKRGRNARVLYRDHFPIVIMCCSEDMCNYPDNPHVKIPVNNSSPSGMASPIDENELLFGNRPDSSSRRDLWFKAAVIAVPIAGGFILIMLIFLAIHMLRKDNRRQRQLVELRRLRQFKAHLLVSDHVTEKNQTNGKLNQKEKPNNLYKNVNIVISRDIYLNEKNVNYDILHKPLNNSFCNAVVTWSELDDKSSTPV